MPRGLPIPGAARLGHLRHPGCQGTPPASQEEFVRSGSGRKFPLLALEARWSPSLRYRRAALPRAPESAGAAPPAPLGLPGRATGSPGGHRAGCDPAEGWQGWRRGDNTQRGRAGGCTLQSFPWSSWIWERFHLPKLHSRGCAQGVPDEKRENPSGQSWDLDLDLVGLCGSVRNGAVDSELRWRPKTSFLSPNLLFVVLPGTKLASYSQAVGKAVAVVPGGGRAPAHGCACRNKAVFAHGNCPLPGGTRSPRLGSTRLTGGAVPPQTGVSGPGRASRRCGDGGAHPWGVHAGLGPLGTRPGSGAAAQLLRVPEPPPRLPSCRRRGQGANSARRWV